MNGELKTTFEKRRNEFLIPVAQKLEQFLKECLSDAPRIDRISSRAKGLNSFLNKAKKSLNNKPKYSNPLDQIQDQIGARIITFYSDDIDRISHLVEEFLRPIEHQNIVPDSYSEFGYFGKHYIMLLPKDVLPEGEDPEIEFFELQIKTLFQHAWGEANHDIGYKPTARLCDNTKRKMAFASAQAWGADMVFNELFNKFGSRDHIEISERLIIPSTSSFSTKSK